MQGTTGAGSVVTPFAISMQAHGLTGSRDSIPPALDGLRADKIDSDGDGKADVDELTADTDPNTPADVTLANRPQAVSRLARGPDWPRLLGAGLVLGACSAEAAPASGHRGVSSGRR